MTIASPKTEFSPKTQIFCLCAGPQISGVVVTPVGSIEFEAEGTLKDILTESHRHFVIINETSRKLSKMEAGETDKEKVRNDEWAKCKRTLAPIAAMLSKKLLGAKALKALAVQSTDRSRMLSIYLMGSHARLLELIPWELLLVPASRKLLAEEYLVIRIGQKTAGDGGNADYEQLDKPRPISGPLYFFGHAEAIEDARESGLCDIDDKTVVSLGRRDELDGYETVKAAAVGMLGRSNDADRMQKADARNEVELLFKSANGLGVDDVQAADASGGQVLESLPVHHVFFQNSSIELFGDEEDQGCGEGELLMHPLTNQGVVMLSSCRLAYSGLAQMVLGQCSICIGSPYIVPPFEGGSALVELARIWLAAMKKLDTIKGEEEDESPIYLGDLLRDWVHGVWPWCGLFVIRSRGKQWLDRKIIKGDV